MIENFGQKQSEFRESTQHFRANLKILRWSKTLGASVIYSPISPTFLTSIELIKNKKVSSNKNHKLNIIIRIIRMILAILVLTCYHNKEDLKVSSRARQPRISRASASWKPNGNKPFTFKNSRKTRHDQICPSLFAKKLNHLNELKFKG